MLKVEGIHEPIPNVRENNTIKENVRCKFTFSIAKRTHRSKSKTSSSDVIISGNYVVQDSQHQDRFLMRYERIP